MSWRRCRLDWLALEERGAVNPAEISADTVFHYSIPALDEIGDGRLEPPDEIGSGKLLLSGGEVLISKLNPRLPRVLLAEAHDVPTLASTEFIALRPGPNVDERFLRYWLGSEPLRQMLNGATMSVTRSQQRVRPEVVTKSWLRVPSIDEQRAIADYLDRETARIDALIEKKQRLISLVQERWMSKVRLIAHSATPWVPLRRTWRIIDCKHITPSYEDSGFPVVSPGDVIPGRLDLGRCHRFVGEANFRDLTEGGRRPQRGDVIYSRNASIGIAAYVDTDADFTMGQDVCLLRSRSANQLWLSHMLNSVGLDQLQEMKVGSTFDRVNIRQLLDLRIPTPGTDEQDRLSRALEIELRRSEETTSQIAKQVTLIGVHREALITAAVTGELDVQGVAA